MNVDVILSFTKFSDAPVSERNALRSRGIIRGKRTGESTSDLGEVGARELAEENLRKAAKSHGCTHVYGCELIPLRDWDRIYGKCRETFYVLQGEGYGPVGERT